jgi:hypothetical protein
LVFGVVDGGRGLRMVGLLIDGKTVYLFPTVASALRSDDIFNVTLGRSTGAVGGYHPVWIFVCYPFTGSLEIWMS